MSDLLSKSDVQDYLALLPDIVLDILEDPTWNDLGTVKQWVAKVLFRNVPNEEIYHGLATALAVKHLDKNPAPSLLQDAYRMGWCLQMFASCYMILDDLYDGSDTRHFRPSWHKEVGLEALNDVTLLESCVYNVLKRYFASRSFYPALLRTFHELSLKMAMSQQIEMELSAGPLSAFTMDNYRKLVSTKMCFYPIKIHVMAAFHLIGRSLDPEMFDILSRIDFHFQLRDDFLDLYGDGASNEAETGTDVQKRRCTWNICSALDKVGAEQRQILENNYGLCEQINVDAVKSVYEKIELVQCFKNFEKREFDEIQSLISTKIPPELADLFTDMMWASFPKQCCEDGAGSIRELARNIPGFLSIFPILVSDLLEGGEVEEDLGELSATIGRLFQWNVPNGKKARGLTLVYAYKTFAGPDATPAKIEQAYILGWCLEMFQAAALIADDVMDASHKRRGRDCWYKVKDVGLEALNDSVILEAAIYRILKKYFGEEDFYLELLDVFHQNLLATGLGQGLDVATGLNMDFPLFTSDRYALIVKYKTSLYSFYLPVVLALLLVGSKDHALRNTLKSLLLDIGHYFQVQDDYLDCYGSVETIGKVGTDIQDGKCSWLVVNALERATAEQKVVLSENYGKQDPVKIARVKELYEELNMQLIFYEFEERTYRDLKDRSDQLLEFAPEQKQLLQKILQSTYKRKF